MWCSRRLVLCAPLLAACGFTPVYGPNGNASALQNRVLVQEPTTRAGYLLVQHLETQLGRPDAPAYHLSLELSQNSEGLAIDAEGNINRYNLIGEVAYILRDAATNAQIASGTVRGFTGYSATGSTVETLASEKDAQERLMVILSDQITMRLWSLTDLAPQT